MVCTAMRYTFYFTDLYGSPSGCDVQIHFKNVCLLRLTFSAIALSIAVMYNLLTDTLQMFPKMYCC